MWQQMICVVLVLISPLITVSPGAPTLFIPGDHGDAVSPAFTPDGDTVYFMRGSDQGASVMVSRRVKGQWSAPVVAPFSGHWRDGDPSMAPDGSFLVFASNRPATRDGQPIDAVRIQPDALDRRQVRRGGRMRRSLRGGQVQPGRRARVSAQRQPAQAARRQ